MDPILRVTIFMDRIRRHPWSRAKMLLALAALVGALAIGTADKLGLWPDALRTERTRTHAVFHR